jgi:hypothetical protein
MDFDVYRSFPSWSDKSLHKTDFFRGLLATFRHKKPFSDDRATNLGARPRRQVAADKL